MSESDYAYIAALDTLVSERDKAQREVVRLREALEWLAKNDANGWVKEKVAETLSRKVQHGK